MKKVFNTSQQVIHLFTQRTQSEARCSNVFFDSPNKIYSYGRHYLLAEFITNDKGIEAIMINNKGYSVTTSEHIRLISYASRQYKQFFTMSCEADKVLYTLEKLIHSLQGARKPEKYILPAEQLYSSFCEFLTFKGLNISDYIAINRAMEVFQTKDVKKYLADSAEIIKAKELQRKKEDESRLKAEVKKFLSFESNRVYRANEDFLRITKNNLFIETSQGVKIPVKNAAILYKMILEKKNIKGYEIQGDYSMYTVISLNGVLKVGCHNINKKNMHSIGKKLLTIV